MPPVNLYVCKNCRTRFEIGWGGYCYVETIKGERIVCPHPGEDSKIAEVLGLNCDEISTLKWKQQKKPAWWWSRSRRKQFDEQGKRLEKINDLIDKRTGYNSLCICLKCKKASYLDIGDAEEAENSLRYSYGAVKRKDERLCPNCGSSEVMTLFEMLGEPCPLCGQGKIEEIETGTIA